MALLTRDSPEYQAAWIETENGRVNPLDAFLQDTPTAADYWAQLGYTGPTTERLSGDNGDTVSPQLLAWQADQGLTWGIDAQDQTKALVDAGGATVAGSTFSIADVGDFFRDAVLIVIAGVSGGSALAGSGTTAAAAAEGAAAGAAATAETASVWTAADTAAAWTAADTAATTSTAEAWATGAGLGGDTVAAVGGESAGLVDAFGAGSGWGADTLSAVGYDATAADTAAAYGSSSWGADTLTATGQGTGATATTAGTASLSDLTAKDVVTGLQNALKTYQLGAQLVRAVDPPRQAQAASWAAPGAAAARTGNQAAGQAVGPGAALLILAGLVLAIAH